MTRSTPTPPDAEPNPGHTSWRLRLLRRHPSSFLMTAQLLSLLVYAALGDTRSGRWLFGAMAAVVVPLTVWVVNRTPAVTLFAWLLAIPAMALTATGLSTGQEHWLVLAALLEALLYFYAAVSLTVYMLERLDTVEEAVKRVEKVFRTDPLITKRSRGVGVLSREDAWTLGVVGPVARGSGLDIDVRKNTPYLVYPDLYFDIVAGHDTDSELP